MIERRIKELAIACEAMSRVGDLYNEMLDTKQLLQRAIRDAQHELEQSDRVTTSRPPPNDDDIPF